MSEHDERQILLELVQEWRDFDLLCERGCDEPELRHAYEVLKETRRIVLESLEKR